MSISFLNSLYFEPYISKSLKHLYEDLCFVFLEEDPLFVNFHCPYNEYGLEVMLFLLKLKHDIIPLEIKEHHVKSLRNWTYVDSKKVKQILEYLDLSFKEQSILDITNCLNCIVARRCRWL